ncbi:MAG: alanine racemase [Chloroflexota bacterium]
MSGASRYADIPTPSMLVDWDVLRRNARRMAAHAARHGVNLRPHGKTHKTREIAQLQLDEGASGLTLARLGELEAMLLPDLRDVLIAFPLVGADKLERLVKISRDRRVLVSLDHLDVASGISDAAAAAGTRVPVLLEIDTGGGRCGVLPERAAALAQATDALPGLELAGIMTHEGHAYAAENRADLRARSLEAGTLMVQTATRLRANGHDMRIVSVGSTPSALDIAEVQGITEIRPGTYVFQDFNQVRLGVASLDDCAARVLATVVARPAPDRAVIDAGTKAVAADRHMIRAERDGYGAVVDHPGWFFARASEEHGVLLRDEAAPSTELSVGNRVEVIPNHICPAINLFDELIIVRKGVIEGRIAVAARGRSR